MMMNKKSKEKFYCFEVVEFKTKAPNGRYLGISSENCDCCGEPITTAYPIEVKDGFVMPHSLIKAGKSLAELHPSHPFLEAAEWQGDGSFMLHFGS